MLTRIIPTPTGDMMLGEVADRIVLCTWVKRKNIRRVLSALEKHTGQPAIEGRSELLKLAERQINEYLAGERTTLNFPIQIFGTPFQKRVWNEIRGIPASMTISYKTLAARIGERTAVRAVAAACGANPLCLIVPCHRVLASGGIGGFAASVEIKRRLLELEAPKIVVAPDSYKGSLTAEDVAEAMTAGIRAAYPFARIEEIPLGDGGEGSAKAIARALNADRVTVNTRDPLMREIEADYYVADDGAIAIIEIAAAAGLTLLKEEERDASATTSYGVGVMISNALGRGCNKILICLGGSATNDGGTGMLQGLGCKFLDAEGRELLGCGGNLSKIAAIDNKDLDRRVSSAWFIGICDVDSPFCGPEGASMIFGPQKGATREIAKALDSGMKHLAGLIAENGGKDIMALRHAGAAGGIGGAMAAYLNASLENGAEKILDIIDFDRRIKGAEFVITGEGHIDRQTLMGKAPYGILKRCQAGKIPVVATGGAVSNREELSHAGFEDILAVTPEHMPVDVAMKPENARRNIRNAITHYLKNRRNRKNEEKGVEDSTENA